MFWSYLGFNADAQRVLRTLLIVAGLVAVAIGLAWKVYGPRIAELYERDDMRLDHHAGAPKLSHFDPAIRAASKDWTRTWHAPRRDPSPQPLSSAT